MLLKLYSYAGTQINDGTNFEAYFPQGTPLMPRVTLEWAKRSKAFPQLAGKALDGGTITIGIICKGTIHTQLETLKALFPEDDYTLHKLIAKDTADGSRQWYLNCWPAGPLTMDAGYPGHYLVTLAVAEPFWRVNVPSSSGTWEVTASGQTKNVAPIGSKQARPVITISPISPRNQGYLYKRRIVIYNRTDLPAHHYKVELTDGGLNTAGLIADASVSNQLNGAINGTVTTINIDTPVGGGLPVAGMGYLDTEQIKWTNNSGSQLTGVTRGAGGTTAASHADNTVIKRSKMLADGRDWRCFVDGTEVERWLYGMNGANSKMWIDLNLSARIELTLDTAISDSGTPATIDFEDTAANRTAFARLPKSGNLLIDSEIFSYSALNKKELQATVKKRALYNTTAAAHGSGATVRRLEHVIWMMYGDHDGKVPAQDDTYQPIFGLNSSMVSRVFSTFWDRGSLRGGWHPAKISAKGPDSDYYTGSHEAMADPATEMGATIQAYELAGVWKADTAEIEWRIYDPAGFTTITVTGAKYRQTTSWPATVACEISDDGLHWTRIFNEATPGSAATWLALSSHSGVDLGGTQHYVRFHVRGSVGGLNGNKASWEAQSVTLALPSGSVPSISMGSEIAPDVHYHLDAKIKNNANGEYLKIACPMSLNDTLTIDCDEMTAEFDDGTDAYGFLKPSNINSEEWLPLEPGETNTLVYTESGVTDVVLVVSWEDRASL